MRSFFGLLSTTLALTQWHGVASASNYPPDYVISTDCQRNGPVEVCVLNREYGGYPRLQITYEGELMPSSWGRIAAFVKLNGRNGLFGMTNRNYQERVLLGSVSTHMCFVRDSNTPEAPPPREDFGFCLGLGVPGGGGLRWEVYEGPKAEEQNLFYYTRDQYGRANAWDIEISFVDQQGRWDSHSGQNYRFRFPQD